MSAGFTRLELTERISRLSAFMLGMCFESLVLGYFFSASCFAVSALCFTHRRTSGKA